MNNKLFITIFAFLIASVSVNLAHAGLLHEKEVCEVCLHIQSNDDGLLPTTETELSYQDTSNVILVNWDNIEIISTPYAFNVIRGPPSFR